MWVLTLTVLMLRGGGMATTLTTHEYLSERTCSAAAEHWYNAMQGRDWVYAIAVCDPK